MSRPSGAQKSRDVIFNDRLRMLGLIQVFTVANLVLRHKVVSYHLKTVLFALEHDRDCVVIVAANFSSIASGDSRDTNFTNFPENQLTTLYAVQAALAQEVAGL